MRRSCRASHRHGRARSACGNSARIASACGESRLAGIVLLANCVRADGSCRCRVVDVVPYALKSPLRAASVGHGEQPRSALRVRACPGSRRRRTLLFCLIGPPSGESVLIRSLRPGTESAVGCVNGLRAWSAVPVELEHATEELVLARTWSARTRHQPSPDRTRRRSSAR